MKINSGDPLAIAEVVRDLHRNTGQPDQSFSERQIYEAALDRLACEVGAVEKTDPEKATEKLEGILSSTTSEPEVSQEEESETALPSDTAAA